jgi:hypothetical protein
LGDDPGMAFDHGGRIELRLVRVADETVEYAVTLATPDAEVGGTARVMLADGAIELLCDADAPGWLVELARSVLRAAWRGRADAGWPRRLTRWRAGPGGR